MSACTAESGTCETCRGACARKPGWFLPGEAERAAELLGMTLAELFATKLSVDYWESYPNIYVLSPASTHMQAGTVWPESPHGQCVFFVDDRCQIHDAKPYECRTYWCGMDPQEAGKTHADVADAWRPHQDKIVAILGRDPREDEDDYGEGW